MYSTVTFCHLGTNDLLSLLITQALGEGRQETSFESHRLTDAPFELSRRLMLIGGNRCNGVFRVHQEAIFSNVYLEQYTKCRSDILWRSLHNVHSMEPATQGSDPPQASAE